MLTRKHYRTVAAIIRKRREFNQTVSVPDCRTECHLQELSSVAEYLADYFRRDNLRFDRSRFMQACGIEDAS